MIPSRTEELVALVSNFSSSSARASASANTLVTVVSELSEPFSVEAQATHVTASVIVISSAGVLLHHHKRFDIWVGPGGHIDGEETPGEAVLRETLEETGLVARHPNGGPELIDVDIHAGPKGHIHLDTRWLLLADPDEPNPPEGESQEVRWMTPDEARAIIPADLNDALDQALARTAV